MNASSSIESLGDSFTVATKTKLLFFTKPHSSVIPFLIEGRMTLERGFQIYYSTTDETVLQELHDQLCQEVQLGGYNTMLQLIKANQPPLADIHLTQYITGFKY